MHAGPLRDVSPLLCLSRVALACYAPPSSPTPLSHAHTHTHTHGPRPSLPPRRGGVCWRPSFYLSSQTGWLRFPPVGSRCPRTSINKKDPKYLQRLKDAERVAREIQKGVGVGNSTNPHLLADRGIESNMTEEELHASVIRPKGPNRYVPPSQRSKGGPPSKPPQSYSAASKPNDSKAQGGGNGPSPPKSTSPTGRNNKAPPSVWNQQRELKADPTTKARTSKSPDVVTQDLKQFSKDLKLNLKTDGKDAKAKDKKLNPAASEFKMSVKAPAFVMPGSAPAAVEAQPVTPTFQQPQGVYPGMMQMQMAQGQQQMRVAYPPNAMAYQQQQQAQMAAYQQQMAQMAQQGYSQQMYQQQQQMLAQQQQQQQQQAAAGYPKGVLAQPQSKLPPPLLPPPYTPPPPPLTPPTHVLETPHTHSHALTRSDTNTRRLVHANALSCGDIAAPVLSLFPAQV